MDANRARFHALWGHAGDWKDPTAAAPDLEDFAGVLRLKSQTPTFGDVSAIKLDPRARRGAARDRFGNWYWIDPSERQILVQSADTGTVGVLWPPPSPRSGPFAPVVQPDAPAPLPRSLAGAAVTRHHALVVGALDPPGLLAFDLFAGGPPRRVTAPAGTAFTPFDVAPLGDGVVVLDREHRSVWAFDRDLVPRPVAPAADVPDTFQPLSTAPPRRTRAAPGVADSVALPAGWPAPVAVEAVTCDQAWVLHETTATPPVPPETFPRALEGSLLAKVDWSAPLPLTSVPALGTRAASALKVLGIRSGVEVPIPVGGHDLALAAPDRLEVALADGAQAVAFSLALEAAPDFIPLRRFEGRAFVAPVPGGDDTRPGYDTAGTWASAAVMPRPQFARSATLVLPNPAGWDGKLTDCVWHRVLLDACAPPGCSIRLAAEVSNDRVAWKPAAADYLKPAPVHLGAKWQPGPRPRAEGSELPFAPALPAGFDTWETLLHGARGQYLRLTLELTGDGTRTPRVRAVRAWYPRFSYLEHYLPAVYRDDATSADFLERFLANAEGTLTGIEDRIVAARALVDPRTAPAEALDWLTGWLGLTASPWWTEQRKRLFLRHAPEILRRRGTIRGLQWALHLELDECIDERIFADARTDTSPYRIVETFRRRAASAVELGDPTALDLPRRANTNPGPGGRWRPAEGPEKLNSDFAAALKRPGSVPFPLCPPPDPKVADTWLTFARQRLGFVPRAQPGDPDHEARWAAFLYRRYRKADPAGAALPETLDVRPSVAADWYLFETVVMAALESAHQFEVLIPASASPSPADLAKARENRLKARAVVRREAPAHCRFEVRLYASAFRVGGSRVGADTLLGRGSLAPEFYDDMALDAAFLGEAFLRPRPPRGEPNLTVVGQTPTFRARHAQGVSPR